MDIYKHCTAFKGYAGWEWRKAVCLQKLGIPQDIDGTVIQDCVLYSMLISSAQALLHIPFRSSPKLLDHVKCVSASVLDFHTAGFYDLPRGMRPLSYLRV